MLNIKKSSIIFSLLFVFSFLIGCATHSPIKQPGLYSDMEAQKNKQTTDQIEIMVRPIVSKTDNKAYYDEDLILYGVLPFHVCFKNINPNESCNIKAEKAALVAPDGASNPPLTLEEVYGSASKSYARALGWGAAFGLVGAATSAINVAVVNDKIKADYESSMIKSGELVSGAYTEGSLFFKIDNKIESLDGWELQFDFEDENGPKLLKFELSGEVEQPRVAEHASESRGVGVHSQDTDKSKMSTSDPQKIAYNVNPQEPWTGKWRVEGHSTLKGIWAMKQSGRIVQSTKDSYFEFKGKVRGNQLEGKLTGDYNLDSNFVITLSSDGQSFKGSTTGQNTRSSGPIKGKRKAGNIASMAPVSLDTNEPWTGKWRVEGHYSIKGKWAMKQRGRMVKSTKDSDWKFEGRVRGNQLEGKIMGEYKISHNFVINISSDAQSFTGRTTGSIPSISGPIKGNRK